MPKLKKKIARKAVKSTAKHTAHGAGSKLKREPVRTVTLLGLGGLVGVCAGWLLARIGSPSLDAPAPLA
jgi:F0F1-type ATP synthase assembly protein I